MSISSQATLPVRAHEYRPIISRRRRPERTPVTMTLQRPLFVGLPVEGGL